METGNYRPIFILFRFWKILEKLILIEPNHFQKHIPSSYQNNRVLDLLILPHMQWLTF